MNKATDPVCGMEVILPSRFHMEYRGKEYFFCSLHCLNAFKEKPEEFLNKERKVPIHHPHHHHEKMVVDFRRRFFISLFFTIPVLFLSSMIWELVGIKMPVSFKGSKYLLLLFSSVVFFYGGYPFLKGMKDELRLWNPGMMTLVGLAVSVAYLYSVGVTFWPSGNSFFLELVTLIDIMLLGHWIEMKSVLGASSALEGLASLLPSMAHLLLGDGSIKEVPTGTLKPGDRVLVKPGERIPADGEVLDGESYIDESLLTGESRPVLKKRGEKVIGGAINGEGSLVLLVHKTGKETFLSQVIRLVQEAQETRSKTQDVADRAAFWLTVIAISTGIITFGIWLFLSAPLSFALERLVTVMVTTCPHALGLAVPLVIAVSTALASRRGLIIRNRRAFEAMRKVDVIFFDKTGTLTEGRFAVTDVLSLDPAFSEEDILLYAGSVERHSEHPIARGIVSASKKFFEVTEFSSIPGKGAKALVNGRNVMVCGPAYLKEKGIEIRNSEVERLFQQGKTVVFLLIEDIPKGVIALGDVIKEESRKAVLFLKEMGIKCIMLTGDNREVADWVAEQVGLDEHFFGLTPQEKMRIVKEARQKGFVVVMAGDGINDAPALAQADAGIAMGAGTDIAIETADIILTRSNPLDVVSLVRLSKVTYRKMIQNLLWAAGYNLIAIPLAAGILFKYGIFLSPAAGAILMSASTIIVAVNARLLELD